MIRRSFLQPAVLGTDAIPEAPLAGCQQQTKFRFMKITAPWHTKLIFLFCFITLAYPAYSQNNKDFKQLFKEADYFFFSEQNYEQAAPLFLLLLDMDPDNANLNYKLGVCYLNIPGQKGKSISFLEKAVKNITDNYIFNYKEREAPKEARFYLGYAYQINNLTDKAIAAYNIFKKSLSEADYLNIEYINQQIRSCEVSKEFQSNPVNYTTTPLGEKINAFPFNFNPAVSGNGLHIVYTVKTGETFHLLQTGKNGTGWKNPIDITSQVTGNENLVSSSLSYDGLVLFLYGSDNGKGTLYESHREGNKWTPATRLNSNINTKYWESSGSLSPDGQTFYFSSNRSGGFGGLDLYRSKLSKNGEWGPAKNLGNEINTPFQEDDPFITSDNKTLFFSSQGHFNMGGFDHFVSTRLGNGHWSVPVNLGYPVNTPDNDEFMAPVNRGDTVYYAPYTGNTFLKQQISMLVFPKNTAPQKIVASGVIHHSDNMPGPDSSLTVSIIDTLSGDTIQKIRPAENADSFSATLPEGDYKVIIASKGYEPLTNILTVPRNLTSARFNLNPTLVSSRLKTDHYIALINILFDFDDYSLNRQAKIDLEKMIVIMLQQPNLRFEIIGHTDAIGSSAYNLALSKKRAFSVLNYIVRRGVAQNRLQTKGVGEIGAIPISKIRKKDDSEARQRNRRVEFRIPESGAPERISTTETFVPDHLKSPLDLKYTVIAVKVDTPLPKSFFDRYKLEDLKYIHQEKSPDGYLYTLGAFLNKAKALQVLGRLIKVGFSEARIVDQQELSDILGQDELPPLKLYKHTELIDSIPVYTIQIAAMKNPPDIIAFGNLEDVWVIHGKDRYYRYAVGHYTGYTKAKAALKEIVAKGYKDAFIRPVENFK